MTSERGDAAVTTDSAHVSKRSPVTWVRAALLAGLAYFLVGKLFALPADNARAWRYAAWLVSGVVFAAHIAYEHFGPGNSPRSTALHTAVGVGLGALALAVAGIIHSWSSATATRWLLALVLWPAFTAIPAFVAAFVLAKVLPRRSSTIRTG